MHPTDQNTKTSPELDLEKLRLTLSPRSIAVIGASRNPAKIGSQILRNIQSGGYQGTIYPINPHIGKIQGLQSFTSVTDVPETIDHAVIAVPAKVVPTVLADCIKKNIPGVSIISAGFKESGPDGEKLEKEIIEMAKKNKTFIIGPNCLGFINTNIDLNATFSSVNAKKGNVVLFSQSGAFGTAILDWADKVNLGFEYFISLGNKAVIDETMLMEFLLNEYEENNENIIFAGYLEDIKQGRKFMKLSSMMAKKHPLVILKPGKTEKTLQAISSHTGSMATEDSIVDTAFKQASILRVGGIQRLFDILQVLSRQSVPRGNRVAIITNAGGPGVATTDLIADSKLTMAELSDATTYALSQKLPEAAAIDNPVDVLGDATAKRYEEALETVLIDENVDAAIVLLTPQAVTEVEKTSGAILEKHRKYPSKPVIAVFIGGKTTDPGVDILNHSQIPIFHYPRQAVSALSSAFEYREAQERDVFDPNDSPSKSLIRPFTKNATIVGKAAETIAKKYGIPIPPSQYISADQDPPTQLNSDIAFPVVAKLISPELLHKTDIDAVKTNLKTMDELNAAVSELKNINSQQLKQADSSIQVQSFISGGITTIVGFKRDPSFGPVLMFGVGGILTELLADTSQRIAPIDNENAEKMITETKISSLLEGYRGTPRRDTISIINCLIALSTIAMENPEITEFDINPFIVLNEGSGGYAVDIKFIVDTTAHNA